MYSWSIFAFALDFHCEQLHQSNLPRFPPAAYWDCRRLEARCRRGNRGGVQGNLMQASQAGCKSIDAEMRKVRSD